MDQKGLHVREKHTHSSYAIILPMGRGVGVKEGGGGKWCGPGGGVFIGLLSDVRGPLCN